MHTHSVPTQEGILILAVQPPLNKLPQLSWDHLLPCRGTPTQETTLLNMRTPTLCTHSVPTQEDILILAVELLANMHSHSRHPTQEGIMIIAVEILPSALNRSTSVIALVDSGPRPSQFHSRSHC